MSDRIEKRIELRAPVSRVWRALVDHREFGEWFRVKLDAPFVPGQISRGHITYPGYEHIQWEAVIQKMEPERLFSFTWHPYAVDPQTDYSQETPTLVEFKLEKTANGTLLLLTESGFDKIPSGCRPQAFRMNDGGWAEQMKNIENHVAKNRNSTIVRRHVPFASIFAALGDETRLSLVVKLSGGRPCSISHLTQGSKLTRQAVTKHLRVLERAEIVRSVRAGRENRFEFDPEAIERITKYLDLISGQWDQALSRLKSFVED